MPKGHIMAQMIALPEAATVPEAVAMTKISAMVEMVKIAKAAE